MGDDLPRRSVMDLVDAALNHVRNHPGKAADGDALFDSSFTMSGPNPGDKEFEIVGSEGQTDAERLNYLQRRVGLKDFPWEHIGSQFTPELELKGHKGGRASDAPPAPVFTYELDESLELPPRPVPLEHTGPSFKCAVTPAEICYLDKRCGSFNSWDNFGKSTYTPPKVLFVPNVPHWRNGLVFAVEYVRRMKARLKPWTKPTYYQELRHERYDKENGLLDAA
jgi:hypothetical protein